MTFEEYAKKLCAAKGLWPFQKRNVLEILMSKKAFYARWHHHIELSDNETVQFFDWYVREAVAEEAARL